MGACTISVVWECTVNETETIVGSSGNGSANGNSGVASSAGRNGTNAEIAIERTAIAAVK